MNTNIISNPKYTIEFNPRTGELSATRNGEPWRDLSGDGLVLSLLQDIEELKQQRQKLIDIGFQMVHVAHSYKCFDSKTSEEMMEWVAKRFEGCGFKTSPCGASWGVLVEEPQI